MATGDRHGPQIRIPTTVRAENQAAASGKGADAANEGLFGGQLLRIVPPGFSIPEKGDSPEIGDRPSLRVRQPAAVGRKGSLLDADP